MKKKSIGAIILAAGKGKRMKSKDVNKVTLAVANKPLVDHIVTRLEDLKLNPIIVVVGFASNSVIQILNDRVTYAYQKKRLGTAHATLIGLEKIPNTIENVLVIYGDEFSYPKKKTQELITTHLARNATLTMLTIHQNNPYGLGRIVRNSLGTLIKIVEEKDATDEERKIQEVNPGCYICKIEFLRKNLPKIKKSKITGEYYLTDIVDLAITQGERVETIYAGDMLWRGVNTKEELDEARQLFGKVLH